MRLNASSFVRSSKVSLVPYEAWMVETYHQWMQDPALLEATGSEPLSLQEERDNQVAWREDSQKLTFILVDRTCDDSLPEERLGLLKVEDEREKRSCFDKEGKMCGDINGFFGEVDTEGFISSLPEYLDLDSSFLRSTESMNEVCGIPPLALEVSLMVAEKECRRKGIAREALLNFEQYCIAHFKPFLKVFSAKIKLDNLGSRNLFEKLGYVEYKRVEAFGEVEYRKQVV